ncbi:MAG TPA: hypothetical protein VFY99_01350 [Solirubrobacterales bacterium]
MIAYSGLSVKRVGGHLRGNVVAYVALFCALGLGTAYAVERNSVKGKHIAPEAVRSSDIRDGAVAPEDQDEVPAIRLFEPVACSGGSVPSNDNTRIAWTQRDFQTPGLGGFLAGCGAADGAGAIQVDTAGIYLVTANLVWNGESGAGTRALQVYRSDDPSPLADSSLDAATAGFTGHSASEVVELDANDEVYTTAFQDSGSELGLAQGDFSVAWLGPAP